MFLRYTGPFEISYKNLDNIPYFTSFEKIMGIEGCVPGAPKSGEPYAHPVSTPGASTALEATCAAG